MCTVNTEDKVLNASIVLTCSNG